MTVFYLLAPLPTVLARRYQDDVGASNACKEVALFLTAGIVVSAYGLPLILARSGDVVCVSPVSPYVLMVFSPQISWKAALLTILGNSVVFPTILGFFLAFDSEDDSGYSMW